MRISKLVTQLFVVFLLTAVMPARAEQGVDVFKDALGKLLQQNADETSSKNVPTNKRQMQLSFAPLVKLVAPSVVNVYAAKKAVRRSPFAAIRFLNGFLENVAPKVVANAINLPSALVLLWRPSALSSPIITSSKGPIK